MNAVIMDLTADVTLECESASMGDLCECESCDIARRAKIQAFVTRWEDQHYGAEMSGVRARETVRPPRLRRTSAT